MFKEDSSFWRHLPTIANQLEQLIQSSFIWTIGVSYDSQLIVTAMRPGEGSPAVTVRLPQISVLAANSRGDAERVAAFIFNELLTREKETKKAESKAKKGK